MEEKVVRIAIEGQERKAIIEMGYSQVAARGRYYGWSTHTVWYVAFTGVKISMFFRGVADAGESDRFTPAYCSDWRSDGASKGTE